MSAGLHLTSSTRIRLSRRHLASPCLGQVFDQCTLATKASREATGTPPSTANRCGPSRDSASCCKPYPIGRALAAYCPSLAPWEEVVCAAWKPSRAKASSKLHNTILSSTHMIVPRRPAGQPPKNGGILCGTIRTDCQPNHSWLPGTIHNFGAWLPVAIFVTSKDDHDRRRFQRDGS